MALPSELFSFSSSSFTIVRERRERKGGICKRGRNLSRAHSQERMAQYTGTPIGSPLIPTPYHQRTDLFAGRAGLGIGGRLGAALPRLVAGLVPLTVQHGPQVLRPGNVLPHLVVKEVSGRGQSFLEPSIQPARLSPSSHTHLGGDGLFRAWILLVLEVRGEIVQSGHVQLKGLLVVSRIVLCGCLFDELCQGRCVGKWGGGVKSRTFGRSLRANSQGSQQNMRIS